jgi:hypothetical protein
MERFNDESDAGTDHSFIIFAFVIILRTVNTRASVLFLFVLHLSHLHGAWCLQDSLSDQNSQSCDRKECDFINWNEETHGKCLKRKDTRVS